MRPPPSWFGDRLRLLIVKSFIGLKGFALPEYGVILDVRVYKCKVSCIVRSFCVRTELWPSLILQPLPVVQPPLISSILMHEAHCFYGKQLMYYTISRAFISIPGIIVSYSFPHTLCSKRKEEKTPNNMPHNPNSQVLTSPMQLPVPPSANGRLPCSTP
jgi:hypothetical protein